MNSVLYFRRKDVSLRSSWEGPVVAPVVHFGRAHLAHVALGLLQRQPPAAGRARQVIDVLGRPVGAAVADASGTAALVLLAGLSTGMYLVRAGSKSLRLTME